MKTIEIPETAIFASLVGDKIYVASSPNFSVGPTSVTIIDTETNEIADVVQRADGDQPSTRLALTFFWLISRCHK